MLLPSLHPVPTDDPDRAVHVTAGFLQAVGKAYEAGLPIAFAGLFAGEDRRRISVPGYPFQRRRHWLQRQSGQAGTPG